MADLPTKPINRLEQFYNAIATGDASQLPTPITREEAYLAFIAEHGGGGGGGGTDDYTKLKNKPTINDEELVGNLTTTDIGIVDGYKATYDDQSENLVFVRGR